MHKLILLSYFSDLICLSVEKIIIIIIIELATAASFCMIMMLNGGGFWTGAYDDEEAAARAYDLAALKYWGPGTLINFPVSL